jgi:hypothetical protein
VSSSWQLEKGRGQIPQITKTNAELERDLDWLGPFVLTSV